MERSQETHSKSSLSGRLYQRVLSLSGHRRANTFLAIISFAESSVFPIPPDIMLVPMVLAKRTRAFWIATICTLASVLGGILGYYIGHELYDLVGRPIIEFYQQTEKFSELKDKYNEWGV